MIRNNFGLEIEKAEDGQFAVEKYTEAFNKECKCNLRAYRLIIMDLGMPRMDGKEASKQIINLCKHEPELTQIVVLTSFTNKKIVDECFAIGVKQVYFKPMNFDNLAEVMEENYFREQEA